MQKIAPCLWFESQAEGAANLYVSLFKNSRINKVTRYGDAGANAAGRPKGSVMTATFTLDGQEFMGLNGGPEFKFSEAVSFIVKCKDQAEIDRFWSKLSEGGEEGPCGWLKDRFGLSWQIVPEVMDDLIGDSNPQKAERTMQAMLGMKKLDIRALESAHSG